MASRRQPDLLLDWTPPQPVASFERAAVHASSVAGRLARAIAIALHDSTMTRDEIAERMTVYLSKPVSKNMLDAYASQGRETHGISAERFLALVHATGDRRLLELMAEPFGWAVIDRKFLTLIDLAAVRDKQDELKARETALLREARSRGML